MRILMVNHEFTITGSSTAFFRLALHLKAAGHQLFLNPINPEDGPIKERYLAAGIPIVEAVGGLEVDLAILNTIVSASRVIDLEPYVRTIWFVNEADVAMSLLLADTRRIGAFAAATAVLYNMPFQHDVFRSFTYNLDPGKFHTASFGVDIDPSIIAHEAVPAKSRALRVVQVGTVERRKRPGDFFHAVSRSGLDIEAVICGKFIEMDEAAQLLMTAEPEKYRVLSGLDDGEVLAWVDSADMFCLASASETQSLAAYEAALLGKPLLLSDLPCYTGVFSHGRNCLMFPPMHIDLLALSMRMYAVHEELREEMGRNAKATAERYSNAAFFARFDAIMASVMGRRI